MVLVEFPAYDNKGNQQGKILACLTNKEDADQVKDGEVYMGQILAVEDGYYQWWLEQTHGPYTTSRVIPFHFCGRPADRCSSPTRYREPIHVDVFRLIPLESLGKIQWFTDQDKRRIEENPLVIGLRADAGVGALPAPAATPKAGPARQEVATGAAGIEGLARALGDGGAEVEEDPPEDKKDKKKKHRKRSKSSEAEDKEKKKGRLADEGDLRKAIEEKTPQAPKFSALDMGSLEKKPKKKKKKDKKKEKDDREYSPSSSSATDELFRSAALPRGLERLRGVHQRSPGRIASLSLLRLQELVHLTQGRGSAVSEVENPLPAVATSYVTQVFFNKYPMGEVALRTARELKTVAAVIDLICNNDPLRSLDILLQRLKALELAHEQGNWVQASQLELILSDQTSAVFRQEVKAAQAEVKAAWAIEAGPSRYQRWKPQSWRNQGHEGGGAEVKEGTSKEDDKPPVNHHRQGQKGKGKGKKGKVRRRWWRRRWSCYQPWN